MMKYKFIYLYLILILVLLIINTATQNLCNLKIGVSQKEIAFGNNTIYDNGKINEDKYGQNALTPFTANLLQDIEYLYASEIHINHNPTNEQLVYIVLNII